MHDAMVQAGHFGVSIVAAGQHELARHFADKSRPLGTAQFQDVPMVPGLDIPAPHLKDALGWLECTVDAAYRHGDHTVFLGTVLGGYLGDPGAGLLFFDGGFHRIGA
jgi:flavin reductase (DIM6/NTAB) family NADH-FMN oxidoreductase RutF